MSLRPLPFEARPIRRLHRPEPGEFWAHHSQEPVVLTGCMEDWKLLKELRARATAGQKLEFLGSLHGAEPVRYSTLPRGTGGHYHFQDSEARSTTYGPPQPRVPFDTFASQLLRSLNGESDSYVYLQAMFLDPGTPLWESLGPGVLPLLSEEQARPMLWAGSDGQVVNLHYDDFLNFICMLEGTKRVTVFAPELMPSMYHAPFDRMLNYAQASRVRMLEPDLERFPLFEQAMKEARVAVLEPGEVLFLPPMWWHHVESYGFNVMINNWVFPAPLEEIIALQENVTKALRLFQDATAAQRAEARAHYVRSVLVAAEAAGAPESGGAREAEEPRHAAHQDETRRLATRLPDSLRQQLTRYYDQFVFQVSGEPFPGQPGALAAMMERNAQGTNYFARD
ncbi:cupin-like domain-containing protein [Archangium lansingense]|uniref:Cupin-like domain-containing protein n=1 Tax=Archangium lansingense TaxID=2995310 RepID=A0ABT4A1K4_9BACT|nr:cupin-like domain-containing protein [Archangium lansinium]MCY1075526.1 cupin-like domain-containing protein [Archangium lansinium]